MSEKKSVMRVTWNDGTNDKEKDLTIPVFNIRGDRVMVWVHEAEKISAGGIIIPDTAQEKPRKATVIMVGPGDKDDLGISSTHDIQVGLVVWFGKYAGSDFPFEGEDFLIMRENDILGTE